MFSSSVSQSLLAKSLRAGTALLAATIAAPVLALDLSFPAPVLGVEAESQVPASLDLPTGVFANGTLPVERVTGSLDRRAWQLDAPRMSLTELAEPLRAQLLAQGFQLVFDCDSRACGGFDFRFAIQVMPEPGMHVDLGDFRFIAARKGDEVVNLLVSRSQGYGFVQLTRVADQALPDAVVEAVVPGPEAAPPTAEAATPAIPTPVLPVTPAPAPGDVAAVLGAGMPVVLQDLVFASGSSALEAGSYGSLQAVAEWLAQDAKNGVILVGHTDDSGGLEGNVVLSKKRAQAVRQVLVKDLGAQAGQVTSDGVGPLSPRVSNLTEDGRKANRRVEAVPVRLP